MRDAAEEAAKKATDLQQQIADTNSAMTASLASIDDRITGVNSAMTANLAKLDKQIAALSDMSDIQRQAAQMQADANAIANTYYKWIENEGVKAYGDLQASLDSQINTQLQALNVAQGQMDLLTQGLGYAKFSAQMQADMRQALLSIANQLGAAVVGVQTQQITTAQIKPMIPYIKQQLKTA
jgi:hypothetical protein